MRVSVEYRQVSRVEYDKFCQLHPDVKVDYSKWSEIIYTFNYLYRDYILETGEIAKYPYGNGDFSITKKKTKRINIVDGVERIILPINWKRSKEEGKYIYIFNSHTNGWRCKWWWDSRSARWKFSDLYNFKPFRVSSRKLAEILKKPNSPHLELYKHHKKR